MINYKKISKKSSHIELFRELYVANFPDSERREWPAVMQLMRDEPRFHVIIAEDGGLTAGFVSYWNFDDFNYIEHLAVDANQRNQGTGSQLVNQIMSLASPVVLEVEPPTTAAACKRVCFYQRLGLVLHDDVEYMQPPYGPGKPWVPLQLMTSPGMSREDIERAVTTLHREVYHKANQ